MCRVKHFIWCQTHFAMWLPVSLFIFSILILSVYLFRKFIFVFNKCIQYKRSKQVTRRIELSNLLFFKNVVFVLIFTIQMMANNKKCINFIYWRSRDVRVKRLTIICKLIKQFVFNIYPARRNNVYKKFEGKTKIVRNAYRVVKFIFPKMLSLF